jgi:hypothetical protein
MSDEPHLPSRAERSPRQDRVLARLRLLGPGPAAFFGDALRLIGSRASFEAVTHLVGHCFREIESALRDVLLPDGPPAGKGKEDNHSREIKAILTAYEIDHADEVALAWLRMSGREGEDALHRAAHRNALGEPRPFDDGFGAYCDRVETLLDEVLDRFEANFSKHLKMVDELARSPEPTASHVKRLLKVVPNNRVTLARFFGQIDAKWVAPLNAAGCFATVPAREEVEGFPARYSAWQLSSYLSRVVLLADQQTRSVIGEIVAGIPDTENPWVNRDLARVALAVPLDACEALTRRLTPRLRSALSGFAEDLSALADRLIAEGRVEVAVEVMRALLELEREPDAG